MKKFIFDFDGLLVNTERMSYKTWQIAGEKYGFDVDEPWYVNLMGRNHADNFKLYVEKFGNEDRAKEIREYRTHLLNEMLKTEGTQIMPGGYELLDFLKAEGYEMALATGSSREKIDYTFLSVPIEEYFDYIITGDKVVHGKPDPEIFLKAADGLNTTPENTIILEDSAQGIRAAHSIGATTVMIPDMYIPSKEIHDLCDFIFDSLFEVIDNIDKINNYKYIDSKRSAGNFSNMEEIE